MPLLHYSLDLVRLLHLISVTQHTERMLRGGGGTFLCSILNIKGDITEFSKICGKKRLVSTFSVEYIETT